MTNQKQKFFNSMWPLCIAAAAKTGIHPEIIFAQSALETGYGLHAPQNNYFGIKGAGASLSTIEYVNGKAIELSQHFASASSMGSSVDDYTRFILSNERYRAFRQSASIGLQLAALQKTVYATDPLYTKKLAAIIDDLGPLEKTYSSPLGVLARATQSPIVTMPPVIKQPVKQQEKSMSDLSVFLKQHAGVVNVAADVIKGLLDVAPIPPAAVATVTDVISALQQHATNVGTVASGLAQSEANPADTTPTVQVETAPAVASTSIEGTALAAALAEAETLLPQVLGDFANGASLSTGVKAAEKQTEVAGIGFAQSMLNAAENLVQPIAKSPTGN